jgi:hypothetical protein
MAAIGTARASAEASTGMRKVVCIGRGLEDGGLLGEQTPHEEGSRGVWAVQDSNL